MWFHYEICCFNWIKNFNSINFESEIFNSIEKTNLNLEFFDLIDDYWTKELS
jgi:hypothetical protein